MKDERTVQITLTTRDIKLIQNYLNKGKPLNDPSNRDCLDVVIRILAEIVDSTDIQQIDIDAANFLKDEFGIQTTIDPYGENSGIELASNGLIELRDPKGEKMRSDGKFASMVQNPVWSKDGRLVHGYASIDNMNRILKQEHPFGNIDSIQLKKDGNMARPMLGL